MTSSHQNVSPLSPVKQQLLRKLLLEKRASRSTSSSQMIPHQEQEYASLSFAQQRLWFLEQLGASNFPYNMSMANRLSGLLHLEVLERSVQEIMRRHAVLRTVFVNQHGQPVQHIRASLDVTIPLIDLASLSAQAQDYEIGRLARLEPQQPFDFVQGPFFRVTLLRLQNDEHILLTTLHHIVADAWSLGILTAELSKFYAAFRRHRSEASPPHRPLLPDLPIQYADFARWQRECLQGELLQKQLDYWQQQLAGAPGTEQASALLQLPTDRPRPAVQTFAGARLSRMLTLDLLQQLKNLSQQENVTLFITLLAAFQILLMRYSGQTDIVIGSPIANRTRRELEGLIGFFVNTLVLRTNLSGNPTFRQLLDRVREVAVQAYAHQDLPFEKLVEDLQPERHLSYQPLFQIGFVLQNSPIAKLELPDVTIRPIEVASSTSQSDLSLFLTEEESGLLAALEYSTDLFDATTMERLLGHWQVLLEAIVRAPEQQIETLPILTETEREQILAQSVGTAACPCPCESNAPVFAGYDGQAAVPTCLGDNFSLFKRHWCVHHLFERQVEQYPDSVALVFGKNEVLTYAELNRRANQLAHYLQSLGVGPEVLVGICLSRSIEMVVGLLAVLKAGGAYVPLDPTYPPDRLAFMIQDTHAQVLLTQQQLREQIPASSAHLLVLEQLWETVLPQSDQNPQSLVEASNLAYIIYTSGSTGVPKGVLVTHEGLCNLALAQADSFATGSGSRILQFASLSFDASIWEIVMALLVGGSLHLEEITQMLPGSDLSQVLQEQAITIVTLPPSALAALPTSASLPALQTLVVAGEACPVELMAHWAVGRNFFNAYGPTEATVCASMAPCIASEQANNHNQHGLSLGHPLMNIQFYLLDRHLQPVPLGVTGEIYLGGVGLARGYLHQPEATALRFVPNPFVGTAPCANSFVRTAPCANSFVGTAPCACPGERLYRTGDLARYHSDGTVEYLGRIDQQVKLRGFRIELGEIEATLRAYPAIQEAVVILREERQNEHNIKGQAPTSANLQNALYLATNDRKSGWGLPPSLRDKYLEEDDGSSVGTVPCACPASPQTSSSSYNTFCRSPQTETSPIPSEPSQIPTPESCLPSGFEASPTSTQRHSDEEGASTHRSVDDGFTPSRPLRSPVPTASPMQQVRQYLIAYVTVRSGQHCSNTVGTGLAPVRHAPCGHQVPTRGSDSNNNASPHEMAEYSYLSGIAHSGQSPTALEVEQYLREHLPNYMVPASVIFLETMPLTPNGKVDRKALIIQAQSLQPTPGHHESTFVAPQSEVQYRLATIWQEVLGIQRPVGIQENFFALGGDSILILQVVARTRQAGWHLTPKQFFQHQTIAQLATVVEALQPSEHTPDRWPPSEAIGKRLAPIHVSTGPDEIEDAYPLTPLQQGLLFHTLTAPQSGVYIEQVCCTLHGQVQMPALERAWQQTIRRHEVLRTAFVWQESSEPLQIVSRSVTLPLSILDWRGCSSEQQEADLQAFLLHDRFQGFDIGQAPLMRLTLIRLSETRIQMIWTHHHLLLDGWSLPLVLQEVLASYRAEVQGQSLVAATPRPYRDYIRWLAEQDNEASEIYWRQVLADLVAPTPLGIDTGGTKQSQGSVPTTPQDYAEEVLQLEDVVTAKCHEYTRREHVTLNTLFQAAWALVLSRYSGQTDVVFGTVVAGRPPELAGVEHMIGLFINTVPVRISVQAEEEVGIWLTRLQEQQLEQRSYEYSSLAQIQRWHAGSGHRDVDRPLFESLLVFENYPLGAGLASALAELSGEMPYSLEVEALQVREQTHYPLTLIVIPKAVPDQSGTPSQRAELASGQHLLLRVSYDRQRFEPATIQRLLLHVQNGLQQLVDHPRQRLAEISLLTAAEHEQLHLAWNATQCNYLQHLCIHQLFEQQVALTPDALALTFEEQQFTYQQLNSQANQLAHRLLEQGIGPDVLVGVCMERSLELVIALLAVIKAGGAYVPLDPSYPQERLLFLLEDTQVPIVLTQVHMRDRFSLSTAEIICPASGDLRSPQNNLACWVEPDNLAYMIYTSGSTGKPKGAMNTHRGICNRLAWMQQAYHLTTKDRVLQKTPFSFDVSVWEFFWPLITGACLIVASPGGHQDPTYLKALIAEEAVTTLHFVPSMLQIFLAEQDMESCGSLRLVISSGEALTTSLQAHFFTHAPQGVQLHNLYGPTEAAIDATYWPCQHQSDNGGLSDYNVPIGRPIANTQIYLLDRNLLPVPIEVPGELYIGGEGLARGYWRQPDLTAERFIANPFVGTGLAPVRGERLYRTGDLARYRSDGAIEYLGRIDQQVKLRGLRIEPGEIEATLRAYPAIQEAVVILREERQNEHNIKGQAPITESEEPHTRLSPASTPNRSSELASPMQQSLSIRKYLVAYVTARSGESLTTLEVQRHLRERLPSYMVPTSVIFLENMPLTPNGKVDRKVLTIQAQSLQPTLEHHEGTFVAPHSEVQHRLATIWQEVLGMQTPVSITDNFFALGGDSILILQVIARTRQVGWHLTPKQFFQHQTIAQLATVMEPLESSGHTPNQLPQQAESIGPVPLTPIQQWFFAQDLPQPQHFNQAVLLQLRSLETGKGQSPLSGVGILGKETDSRRDRGFPHLSDPFPHEKPLSAPANHTLAGAPDPLSLRPPKYLPLRGQAPWSQSTIQRHLQQVVDTLLIQHDSLRLRYERTAAGWQQRLVSVAEATANMAQHPRGVLHIDLTHIEASDLARTIEDVANCVQASLDLSQGPLMRVVLFNPGHEQPARLLIVIHHLAVDGVSWRVLLSDLRLALAQLQRNEPLTLPPRTVSFQRWAQHLQELAQSAPFVQKERTYWLKAAQVPTVPLPLDFPGGGNTQTSARQVRRALTKEETRLLLQEAIRPYRSHIQELLLVPLLQTLLQYSLTDRRNEENATSLPKAPDAGDSSGIMPNRSSSHRARPDGFAPERWMGSQQIRLDLEGHGREELIANDLDVSSTVGWFTSLYPVLFTLPADADPLPSDKRKTQSLQSQWIKTIKEQLRSVPHKGISYGLLRYYQSEAVYPDRTRELQEQLASAPPSQVSFNYLGQFDQTLMSSSSQDEALQPAPESSGEPYGPQNPRSYLLDLNALVVGGQLHLQWTYSEQLHHHTTIERLADEYVQRLRDLLTHCLEPSAGGFTPSDFLAGQAPFLYRKLLDQETLDQLLIGHIHQSEAGGTRTGASPISTNLGREGSIGRESDRKGGLGWPQSGDGVNPSSTLRHGDVSEDSKSRSVDEGLAPSPDWGQPKPPLRSPGAHHAPPPKLAPMGASPFPTDPNGIEDIYPLTPLQQGLLFHTLTAPQSGAYIEQVCCTLHGQMQMPALERAWQQIIRRHEVLRTAFVWQESSEPLQIVSRSVTLPLSILDWRGCSSEQQKADLQAFLLHDRFQGFDVGQAPLMRLTLIRLGETRTQMIWTYHHLLLDGWSLPLVLQEVLASYRAEVQGQSLVATAPRPYRDYIRWLAEQDSEASEIYWQQVLAGLVAPTPLGVDTGGTRQPQGSVPTTPQNYAEEALQIDSIITVKCHEYTRRAHVTLNTLLQAAWALVLSRYSGQTDVVFGTVVAGRPPELAGVEHMIGLFINTVPVRISAQAEEEVGIWLTRLQEQQLEQRSHEYSSLTQIQRWHSSSDHRDADRSLFESLFIFENYPIGQYHSNTVGTGLAPVRPAPCGHLVPTRGSNRGTDACAYEMGGSPSYRLEVEALQVREQTHYPLTLTVVPKAAPDQIGIPSQRAEPASGQPLFLRVSYDRQRFEPATIQRLLLHLQNGLQQLVDNPQQRLAEISLLTAEEREQVLAQGTGPTVQWNATQCDYPQHLCIHQLFEQQVELTPDTLALTFEKQQFTYQQLNSQANQLAHRLLEQGIGPDRLVGVCMERSLELVVGLLAILKAGGAYVPLDPSYPAERLAWMLTDAQPVVVLTQTHLMSLLSSYHTPCICLDADWERITPEPSCNPTSKITPENLAYVIYTSGSTGKPKGTMVMHRNVTNFFTAMDERIDNRRPGIWLAVTSISFDISVLELFWTLTRGFHVVVRATGQQRSLVGLAPTLTPSTPSGAGNLGQETDPRRDRGFPRPSDPFPHEKPLSAPANHTLAGAPDLLSLRPPKYLPQSSSWVYPAEETLAAQIKKYGITHLQCTPSQASMFLLEPGIESTPGSLQKLLLGGEAWPISLVKQLSKVVQGEIHNMYGPTETTVWSTTYQMEQSANTVSLGHPIANTQVYILDNHLQLLPVGVPGELFIGGKGVVRGYLNQPALTAARFVPHPFSDLPGERLYRTGDLARYRSDGTLEYLGRLDQQVKLRGFRIELGEIEAVLCQHPNIQEGVVVLRAEEQDRKYLVAYVVVRPEEFSTLGTSPEATVQEYLRTQLPDYMIPTRVVFLQAWPLTPNGKIDRKALPAPDWSQLSSNTEIAPGAPPLVAPQTPLQEQLATIWAELLHLPQVSIHHNFFELGGHSLLAVQLLNRMNKQFGVSLSLPMLSQVLTIEQAATLLEKVTRPAGPPTGAARTSPCVLIQPASLSPTLDHRPQEKPPFFCIHPSIGDIHCFLDLAKHLRHDRPFYGIQAPGLNIDQALFYSVEEIAAAYIGELLAVQPEDPYFLGGYSFGGLVAFEMARQLQAQGSSVAFLALLDSYPRELDPSASTETWSKENYASSITKMVESLSYYWNKKVSISYTDLCHLQPDEQLAYTLDRLKEVQIVPDDTDISQLHKYIQVHEAHDFCLRKYQPRPYPGHVTLLRSESAEEDPSLWTPFSSEPVEVYTVPGDHLSMVTEPHVQSLAVQLQQCLDKSDVILYL